jgi:hypothetical protein
MDGEEAVFGAYVPGGQLVQAEEPLLENVPILQTAQVKADKAPIAVEYVPAIQVVQLPLPISPLYVPGKHGRQVFSIEPEMGENCPAEHGMQASIV